MVTLDDIEKMQRGDKIYLAQSHNYTVTPFLYERTIDFNNEEMQNQYFLFLTKSKTNAIVFNSTQLFNAILTEEEASAKVKEWLRKTLKVWEQS